MLWTVKCVHGNSSAFFCLFKYHITTVTEKNVPPTTNNELNKNNV